METTTQPILTIEQAIEKLKAAYPRGVQLYYVDYNDNLNNQQNIISDIIKQGYTEENIWERWDTYETVSRYMKDTFTEEELECIRNDDTLLEAVQNWFYENDTSDPLKALAKNTNHIRVRIPMYSNYDCINSISMANLDYPNSYLADAIDTLQINPREVYNLLKDIERVGEQEPRPDIPERNPYISAKDFVSELRDNYGDGLWTFVGLLDISDCIGHGVGKKITIPKGNKGGFFASGVGSGSCIEAVLLRDMTIDLTETIHPTLPEYMKWNVLNDNDKDNGYNMSDVYGPTKEFYTDEIILHHNDDHGTVQR